MIKLKNNLPNYQMKLSNISSEVTHKIKSKLHIDSFVKSRSISAKEGLQQFFDCMPKLSKQEKKYFEGLYALGKDKFNFIVGNKKMGKSVPYFHEKEFLDALHSMPPKTIKQTYNEVENLYKSFPKIGVGFDKNVFQARKPTITNFAQLTILKSNNKKAYEYIIKNPDKDSMLDLLDVFSRKLNGSAFTTLNVPQIRQIERKGIERVFDFEKHSRVFDDGYKALHMYTNANNLFYQRAGKPEHLNRYLSNHIIKESFNAYRGENNTEVFNSIPVDKNMAIKTKWYVLKNVLKSARTHIQYTNEKGAKCKDNLFSFIMAKKKITLSDAMQVAKYGNKKYQKDLAQIVESTKIEDNKFKALTFDTNVAKNYLKEEDFNTTGIFHNVNVKEGLEGVFSNIENRQAEFVLNNNSKIMTFKNVHYVPEQDVWTMESSIASKK